METKIEYSGDIKPDKNEHVLQLFSAIAKDDLGTVQALVPDHVDVNTQDPDSIWDSPLACATSYGYVSIMGYLIDSKAHINHAGKNKRTALHIAVEKGYAKAAHLLVLFGANPDAQDAQKITPLGLALEKGNGTLIAQLVPDQQHKKPLEKKPTKTILEPSAESERQQQLNGLLFDAVTQESLPMIISAVDKGANVNAREPIKQATALHIAVGFNNVDIIQYLLSKGADPKATTPGGVSLLHVATHKNNIPMMAFLIDQGVPVNACSISGESALHIAVVNRNEQAAHLLVTKGIDIALATTAHKKAGDMAFEMGNQSMLQCMAAAYIERKLQNSLSKPLDDIPLDMHSK